MDTDLDGTPDVGCNDCLKMNYDWSFKGKTLQIDETYVSGVDAYPQTHHVALQDQDGDEVYKGSITARHDFPTCPDHIYMDVIDYEVTTDGWTVTGFKYVEHKYYKYIGE